MSAEQRSFYELAERAWALERSGKKIIRLNIGSTELPVPEEAVNVLRHVKSGPCGYGPAAGLDELRDVIAAREHCAREQIAIGSGSKFLLGAVLNILKKRGGDLVFPAPYWPAYPLIAAEIGFPTRIVATTFEKRWELPEIDLAGAGAVLLCNPLNPTSTIYSDESVKKLSEAAQARGIPLVIDEAYRDLAFRSFPVVPSIRVRSFSKEFNMEGYRLGYVVAEKELIKELTAYIQLTTTCVPVMLQRAAVECIKAREKITEHNREIWIRRLRLLSEELKLGGFEFSPPESGMYIFARHPDMADSTAYAFKMLEHGVAVAPGSSFGPYKNFIRLSASADEELLRKAARRLGERCGE